MMFTGRIIVVGGSNGALDALRTMMGALPMDLAAALLAVVHTSPTALGYLDRVLARAGRLPVAYANDNEPIRDRRLVLAPPDRHLLVKPDHLRVTRGPRENRFRPAIDPLFRTAAAAYGARVVGVVLSGALDDGAMGLGMIKSRGGIAIVQDPDDAVTPAMPEAALRHVQVDHVAAAGDIARLLVELAGSGRRLVRGVRRGEGEVQVEAYVPTDPAEGGDHGIHTRREPPSPFTCPECGGALWESADGNMLEFRCHVGHRYTGEGLVGAQGEAVEQALWAGLRALEEASELKRRMARRAHDRGMRTTGIAYDEQAREAEQRADMVRRVLMPDVQESRALAAHEDRG
jgi:two-component system, chemotaxis family, protein-glutamate methylesterase/glutaminase